MNLELRMKVLTSSIKIEDALSLTLSHLFKIKKDESLTLGMKSSSLSFKSKVDLLRDLGRISQDDQKSFMLFMEIRNKLAHSLPIDSMLKALNAIDKSKTKQLLSFSPQMKDLYRDDYTDEEKEKLLTTAFLGLELYLAGVIVTLLERLIKDENEESQLKQAQLRHEVMEDVFKAHQQAIDEFSKIADECFLPDNSTDQGFAKKSINALFFKHFEVLRPEIKDFLNK